MRLLVSVRSADEVEPALAGGADIIDAKEPANGPLGPVSAVTLAQLVSRVPTDTPFSLALGDVTSAEQVTAAITALELPARQATSWLKVGFAGVRNPNLVQEIMAAAVRHSALRRDAASIVAVAYADSESAGSLPAELILRLAAAAGVAGVLVDTYDKDGPGLMRCWSAATLASWTSLARRFGMLVAVAGRLGSPDVATVALSAADILGFRGAACDAGRSGMVSMERVRLLRRCLDAVALGEGRSAYPAGSLGETRGSLA